MTLKPQPGDVVRLDGDYDVLVKPGELAVIDGSHFGMDFDDGKGPLVLAVFHASAFRGPSRKTAVDETIHVSCSGGPCPFIPIQALVRVGTTERDFWQWKDHPRAGGAEHYTATVNLWSWPYVRGAK